MVERNGKDKIAAGGKATTTLSVLEDFKNPRNLLFGFIYAHLGGGEGGGWLKLMATYRTYLGQILPQQVSKRLSCTAWISHDDVGCSSFPSSWLNNFLFAPTSHPHPVLTAASQSPLRALLLSQLLCHRRLLGFLVSTLSP